MLMPNLSRRKSNRKTGKPVGMRNHVGKTAGRLARAVSIGTSRSTGWHSAPPPTCSRPLLSVTYKHDNFGSRVAYSNCVVHDRFRLFLLKT